MDGLPEAQKRHLAPSESTLEELRLVIAIDYGTTYTGMNLQERNAGPLVPANTGN
jgi:hypothetical protein